MGITEDQFKTIWQAIWWWMRKRGFSSAFLASLTSYSEYHIEKGIRDGSEWITSDFVHDCVEAFGIVSARQKGPEEMVDVLTDEECVDALTVPIRGTTGQSRFWV